MKQTNKQNLLKGVVSGMLLFAGAFSAQTTYTFTSAGATGRLGPTQGQLNTAYASTNLNGLVVSNSGIQTFTVPVTGPYRIDARGASGGSCGSFAGGLGAKMVGDFTLTAGSVLKIIVGQVGINGLTVFNSSAEQAGGTGGGGSFVSTNANVAMVVAGGGGGGSQAGSGGGVSGAGINAPTTNNGIDGGGAAGSGGVSGAGGLSYNWTGWHGATGGGGFTGNGVNNSAGSGGFGTVNTPGISFTNGGTGGTGGSSGRDGGFGGGGASGFSGAGGGGYSGGGAGTLSGSVGGGGGGSYNNGVNQNNTAGFNTGNGTVLITLLYGANVSQTSNILCNGLSTAALSSTVTGGTAPYTYTWAPTGGNAATASGLSAGVYTLTAKDANNILTTSIFTVTQPSSLALSVASQTNVSCFGGSNGSAVITASGSTAPYTYTWSPTGGNTTTATSLIAGTYSVLVKDANNCSTTATVSITQPVAFSVTASANNTAICSGNTLALTGSGANTYTWTGGVSNGVSFTPTASASYTVTGTNTLTGCTASTAISITVNTTPTISVNSGTSCAGSNFVMVPTGAATYSFSNGSATVNPTSTTSYTVSGTSQQGCPSASIAVSTVTVVALPSVNLTAATSVLCVTDNSIALTGSPTGGVFTGSNVIGSTFAPVTTGTTGTFTPAYSYTDVATGCSKTATLSIVVNACTGLNQLTKTTTNLNLYPNPSNGLFTIETGTDENKTISILDVTGRVIRTENTTELTMAINLTNFANGLYYVSVKTNSGTDVIKVIKE